MQVVTHDEVKAPNGPRWLDKLRIGIKKAAGMNVFLCGNCKWNWRSACNRPERPNATWCPDYVKKGK